MEVTPIWNTYGLIPGHIKDEVIVVGNHRDGECCSQIYAGLG
jgi:N-acetylated-alpha-linked acidic dipeptidase